MRWKADPPAARTGGAPQRSVTNGHLAAMIVHTGIHKQPVSAAIPIVAEPLLVLPANTQGGIRLPVKESIIKARTCRPETETQRTLVPVEPAGEGVLRSIPPPVQ